MAKASNVSHDALTRAFDYEPDTGVFTWKIRPSNRVKIGDRAGVLAPNGYRFIVLDGQKMQASRVAWFYVHKVWPKGDIVFADGNTDNCAIANLSDRSRIEAARLRSAPSTNTSGYRGVSPWSDGKWKASITCNYHQIMLGVFSSKEEASDRYEEAAAIVGEASTPEEAAEAAARIIQIRRKRVAWARLERSGRPHVWANYEMFASDVGRLDDDEATIAAVDEGAPIGAGNMKWLTKLVGKFDMSTNEGRAAYQREYRKANPGRWKHSHLVSNYKIDYVEYARMLVEQKGVCAICDQPETKVENGVIRTLSVDHDHETGAVRGLLCASCNMVIGYAKDDVAILQRAIGYLRRYGKSNVVPFEPSIVGGVLGTGT